MKRMVDDKEIRNFDDRITALEHGGTVDVYTKAESDAKFQTISGMSAYATTTELNNKQDTLTAGTGIDITSNVIAIDNTVALKTDLNSKQDTLSAGNGINIVSNEVSVDTDYVVTKDSNNNVDGILQVAHLQSEDWEEEDDCKAHIYLVSGLRKSRVTLESEGEETGSSIMLQGTTAVGSEGTVQISGTTNFVTDNRLTVTDGNNNTESVAYLSDIVSSSVNIHYLKLTQSDFEVYCTLITNSNTAFNVGTLTNYLNTNSLTVSATGIGDNGVDQLPVAYIKAATGFTPGTVVLAVGLVGSTSVSSTIPMDTFTVTDTVITVKAI